MHEVLEQAVEFLTSTITTAPTPEAVVQALLEAEKTSKRDKIRYNYAQMLGTWQLGFITGTKRVRQRTGVMLGAGRFLPRWLKIQLSYLASASSPEQGTVQNAVEFGPLEMVLTGPVQFYSRTNILAFDFTRIKVSLSGFKLYAGYIRDGKNREVRFYEQSIKEQAFFTYFLVENSCIAARGRGGGLAIWTKVEDS
ncbi:MAG: hypothetical protein QNJ47_24075 [Nostocaceae cyanobacterium]|nr:hypothetical protein [Nostocaceae cyanobacterium]